MKNLTQELTHLYLSVAGGALPVETAHRPCLRPLRRREGEQEEASPACKPPLRSLGLPGACVRAGIAGAETQVAEKEVETAWSLSIMDSNPGPNS